MTLDAKGQEIPWNWPKGLMDDQHHAYRAALLVLDQMPTYVEGTEKFLAEM